MYKSASDKSCELWLNTNDDDDELLLVMTMIQRSPTSEPLKICHCSFSSVQISKSKMKQTSLQSSVIQDVFVLCLVARALTCPEDREIVQIPLPAAAKAGPGAAEGSAAAGSSSAASAAASRKRPLGNDAASAAASRKRPLGNDAASAAASRKRPLGNDAASAAASRKRPLGNDAATDENAEDRCV